MLPLIRYTVDEAFQFCMRFAMKASSFPMFYPYNPVRSVLPNVHQQERNSLRERPCSMIVEAACYLNPITSKDYRWAVWITMMEFLLTSFISKAQLTSCNNL